MASRSTRSALQLNWEVRDVLKIAGSQAGSYLAHRASADGLAVARQFESFNRMSTFVVHDLADPQLLLECRTALDELTQILKLGDSTVLTEPEP